MTASAFAPTPADAGETLGPTVIIAAVTSVSIAAAFVGLRFITRGLVIRTLGLTDWIILFALVCDILQTVGQISQVTQGGVGRHFSALTWPMIQIWFKFSYFTNVAYVVALVSVKTSILLLYLRILSSAFIHRACYVVFAVVSVLNTWALVSNIVRCVPVEAYWDRLGHPDAWCWQGPAKWWADISVHIFTELAILILPIPFVWRLNMPLKEKIGVACLFGLGIFVCAVSVSRIPSIARAEQTKDPSWDAASIAVWTCIELNTMIVCACGMTLRPLAARLFPQFVKSGYRRHDDPGAEPGQYPLTIGTRRNRNLPADPLALDTEDRELVDEPRVASSPSQEGSSMTWTSKDDFLRTHERAIEP